MNRNRDFELQHSSDPYKLIQSLEFYAAHVESNLIRETLTTVKEIFQVLIYLEENTLLYYDETGTLRSSVDPNIKMQVEVLFDQKLARLTQLTNIMKMRKQAWDVEVARNGSGLNLLPQAPVHPTVNYLPPSDKLPYTNSQGAPKNNKLVLGIICTLLICFGWWFASHVTSKKSNDTGPKQQILNLQP